MPQYIEARICSLHVDGKHANDKANCHVNDHQYISTQAQPIIKQATKHACPWTVTTINTPQTTRPRIAGLATPDSTPEPIIASAPQLPRQEAVRSPQMLAPAHVSFSTFKMLAPPARLQSPSPLCWLPRLVDTR